MPPKHYKYKAFISYSHKDEEWGDWLHEGLENYEIPFRLVRDPNNRFAQPRLIPKRLYPIFRDREELPTSAALGTVIDQALKDSANLVIICSPRAAQSKWVNEEIMEFKRLGRADRIFCLIVDGTPNASKGDPAFDQEPSGEVPEVPPPTLQESRPEEECFPVSLMYEMDQEGNLTNKEVEPVAADAREEKDGERNALLKLIAGLINVGFDELKQREAKRQRRRKQRWLWISIALGLLVLGLISELLNSWTKIENLEKKIETLEKKIEAF
jgi:hypothetical protein